MVGGSWWMDQRLIDLIGSSVLVNYNLRIKKGEKVSIYSEKKTSMFYLLIVDPSTSFRPGTSK